MTDYQAPTIVGREPLHGSLGAIYRSLKLESDAEIKHAVHETATYAAPAITTTHDLTGDLTAVLRSDFDR